MDHPPKFPLQQPFNPMDFPERSPSYPLKPPYNPSHNPEYVKKLLSAPDSLPGFNRPVPSSSAGGTLDYPVVNRPLFVLFLDYEDKFVLINVNTILYAQRYMFDQTELSCIFLQVQHPDQPSRIFVREGVEVIQMMVEGTRVNRPQLAHP